MTEQLALDLSPRALEPAPVEPPAPPREHIAMEYHERDGQVMMRFADAEEPPPAPGWVAFHVPPGSTEATLPRRVDGRDQAHAEQLGATLFGVSVEQVFAAPASFFPADEPLPLTVPLVAVTCDACSRATRLINGGIDKCACGKVIATWLPAAPSDAAAPPVPPARRTSAATKTARRAAAEDKDPADIAAEITESLAGALDIMSGLEADLRTCPNTPAGSPFMDPDAVLLVTATEHRVAMFTLCTPEGAVLHEANADDVVAALAPRERRALLRAFRRVVEPPAEPEDLGAAFAQAMQEQIERVDEDMQDTCAATARLLGCSVEELETKIAEQQAEEKAERDARRGPPKPRGRLGKRAAAAPDASPEEAARRTLTPRQQELLAAVEVDDNRATFGPDAHIPDWPALKIVLESLGGVYQPGGRGKGGAKRKGAFRFADDVDAAEVIRLAHATGEIFDPKLAGLFETPVPLADHLVTQVPLVPGCVVLEPEAGRGRIALAVRRRCPSARVLCIEALADNRAELRRLGFEVVGEDFLALRPADLPAAPTVVLANPPFARGDDVRHMEHALGFLPARGHLAAIMSSGVAHRDGEPFAGFRARVVAAGGTITANPDGSFLESGTGVRTVTVVLQKP